MPLPAKFLARLRRLPLRLRTRLSGGMEGLHPSKLKGHGLTFVENRAYVPGDDPRFINWPLTARTGEPIIKRFESSRDLVLWLVIDPSPSMFLGDPVSPLRWALEIVGAAMATINASGDRLGIIVPGDDRMPALRLAPKRGRVHALQLIERLVERGPAVLTPESWTRALGHWGASGHDHRWWILSNGAGLQGLAPLMKPIAARHRVVWFRPEMPHLRRMPNWPDPKFSPAVERQTWDILKDPVVKIGAWMKAGGA